MKKPTLSVAIPAYNEAANIENLLLSLLSQKQKSFEYKDILVYTDAGTDQTPQIVKRLHAKYPQIKIKEGKQRIGKYMRVNQIFSECVTDILIVLDADISLVGDLFLENLAIEMRDNPAAQMIAAHQVFLRPNTFIGKVIYTDFLIWDCVRWSLPNHGSANNYYGSATAYRGSFARSVRIPPKIYDPHLYIFLCADKTQGFFYCMSAQIRQWPISTIGDYKKLLRRSLGKKDLLIEKIFHVTTEEIYAVPSRYKVSGLWKAFVEEPFFTPVAILFNIFMHKIRPERAANPNSVWNIVTSTKKPFYAK